MPILNISRKPVRRRSDMALTEIHAKTAEACLEGLAATPDGLTAAEAARRLAEHGPNRLPETRARGPFTRFLTQFHNVLIYVLLMAERLRFRWRRERAAGA